jgi:hypothetical protein
VPKTSTGISAAYISWLCDITAAAPAHIKALPREHFLASSLVSCCTVDISYFHRSPDSFARMERWPGLNRFFLGVHWYVGLHDAQSAFSPSAFLPWIKFDSYKPDNHETNHIPSAGRLDRTGLVAGSPVGMPPAESKAAISAQFAQLVR